MATKKKTRPLGHKSKSPNGQRGGIVFAAYFTTSNGRRIYAADYGYEAWPIGGSS